MVTALAAEAGSGPDRFRLLRATGLLDDDASPLLHRLTALAARVVRVPVALVSLVDEHRQVFPSQVGLPEPWTAGTPLSHSFCRRVVVTDAPLIVDDARTDDRVRGNPAIEDIGVVAYAGYPIRAPQGQTLGSFAVIDHEPRAWSAGELLVVEDLAAAVEAEIAVRLSHAGLKAESRRRHAILNASADAFVTADEQGLVCGWNTGAERLFGWAEEEALGRPLGELMIPGRFRAIHERGLARARREGRSVLAGQHLELVAVHRDGHEFPVSVVLQEQVEDGGTLFHAVLHDITDRKRREQNTADSEARFRTLFESSPIGIALVGLDGSWLRVNAAVSAITGYPQEELLTIDFQSITHPEDLDRDLELLDDLLAGRIPDYRVDKRYLRRDGVVVWCLISVSLIRDEAGQPLHFVSQIVDVTGRKEAEARAARETERLRTVVAVQREVTAVAADRDAALELIARRAMEALPPADGCLIGMVDGTEVYAVAAAGRLVAHRSARVGISGSLAGRVVTSGTTLRCDDVETDDRVDRAGSLSADVRSIIIAPLFADGRVFGTLGVSSELAYAFDDADTEQLTLLADALTGALRHADDAMHRERALDRANEAVVALKAGKKALRDSETRFRSQFTNAAVGQVIRTADDRIEEVNPAFAAMLGRPAEHLLGEPVARFLTPETRCARNRELATLIAGRADSYQMEGQVVQADGRRLDVAMTVSAIRGHHGWPERYVCLFQDISDRKAAEAARDAAIADLADRNRELERANQLKQDLMGMLGHEIGNPLASILGYLEIIGECWGELPENGQREMLAAIDRNAHLINGIVGEVLTLVTLDAGQITATPETVLVAEHLETARANTGSLSTTIECPAGLTASVQPGHLGQILTNLLSNARKYGGGATTITAANSRGTVRIAVADTGPGVPEELRPHLFDRFSRAQSTARTVKGTGLGLYIVRELARANGGDVHYEAAPEQGSVFVLTIPR